MYDNRAKQMIEKMENNKPFGVSDLSEAGNYDAVRKQLIRLAEGGEIKRLFDGVYYKPVYSKLTGELLPVNIDKVASYLAERYGWTIIPSEELALNYFGLSTQVPAKYVYLSSGPYRDFLINDTMLSFKHTANRNLLNMSKTSAILVQALRGLGKGNINENDIEAIRSALDKEEIYEATKETKNVSAWINQEVKRIGEAYND